MKNIYRFLYVILIYSVVIITSSCNKPPSVQKKKYTDTWSSLKKHSTPDWLEDAKFGIYCHWGLITIQNLEGNEDKELLELIPQFKAENFNPAEWAELFKNTGAEFAGPVGWHASPFVHWDSELTELNSMDMGPGVDIVGSLEKEIKKRGMKFILTLHYDWDETFYENCREPVDKYKPDIVYVDGGFGRTVRDNNRGFYNKGRFVKAPDYISRGVPEKVQRQFIAHFFNKAIEWGKEVEFLYKTYDVPPGIGVRNYENGSLDGLAYDPWFTEIDMNINPRGRGNWFYKETEIKSANHLIDLLIDVVSKNGRFMLNVPPKADGTFSDTILSRLAEIRDWLKINGEAIYGSTPWNVYGEGPTEMLKVGHHADHTGSINFSEKDFRFTVKDYDLYAFCLGWPGDKAVIRTLGTRSKLAPGEIDNIQLLGSNEKLSWDHKDDALYIDMPVEKPCDHAIVFKINRN